MEHTKILSLVKRAPAALSKIKHDLSDSSGMCSFSFRIPMCFDSWTNTLSSLQPGAHGHACALISRTNSLCLQPSELVMYSRFLCYRGSCLHRRRKVKNIGGGPRFRILGAKGGQIPSRHMTSY